jgi:hypothetical protein
MYFVYLISYFQERTNKGMDTHAMTSSVFDEHVASLLLLLLLRDTKEGWDRWGRLVFVNKAWRDTFKTHHSQVIEYRIAHMQHMLHEKNRQLQLFRVCCSCRVAWSSLWSSDDASDDDAAIEEQEGSPSPTFYSTNWE